MFICHCYSFEGDPCRRDSSKYSHSRTTDSGSRISSRITTGIHVKLHVCTIDNWIIELFAVASYRKLYTHMHGLTFETSIWLLAGSTRFSWFLIRCSTWASRIVHAQMCSVRRQRRHIVTSNCIVLIVWLLHNGRRVTKCVTHVFSVSDMSCTPKCATYK